MTTISQTPSVHVAAVSDGMSEKSSPTTVYILVPPSPLFASHWSFFLPDTLPFDHVAKRHGESDIGRRIHVSGDRLNGFKLEIIRNYDIRKHKSVGNRRFLIGALQTQQSITVTQSAEHELKDEDEGGGYIDNMPRDEFEKICVQVEAPGKSLRSAGEGGGRKEVKDCQWWVREVAKVAVDKVILVEGDQGRSPLDIVAGLPKH